MLGWTGEGEHLDVAARKQWAEARELQYRANEVAEAYATADIKNLPGIKLLLQEIFNIPVGYCSPNGPFKGMYYTQETSAELIETFKKNILVKE